MLLYLLVYFRFRYFAINLVSHICLILNISLSLSLSPKVIRSINVRIIYFNIIGSMLAIQEQKLSMYFSELLFEGSIFLLWIASDLIVYLFHLFCICVCIWQNVLNLRLLWFSPLCLCIASSCSKRRWSKRLLASSFEFTTDARGDSTRSWWPLTTNGPTGRLQLRICWLEVRIELPQTSSWN